MAKVTTPTQQVGGLEPIERLKRDRRDAAKLLTTTEVRYLIDLYYQIQDFRKAAGNQASAMQRQPEPEPVLVIGWARDTMEKIEDEIRRWMDVYTTHEPTGMGQWAKDICGIGPVLSAALLAHIDIRKAPTVGHIWRFAGLDPTMEWGKGQKRPFNADLKVVCWKLGQSFMKVQANEADVYGKLYKQRKLQEIERNEAGAFKDQAVVGAARVGKTTDAWQSYSQGKLPPAHIDARARRWAVKQFLADWHGEAYRRIMGQEPPLPYPIAILGHAHYRRPGTTEITAPPARLTDESRPQE